MYIISGTTVIESIIFNKIAKELMSEEEKEGIIDFISINPKAGAIMRGTGGARKLRWKIKENNKGKSGGVRIIYYYHNTDIPIFLLTLYPKNVKDNLSEKQKKSLKKYIDEEIKYQYEILKNNK